MLGTTKVALIGAGVMAEAILKGLLSKKLVDPSHIFAADVRPERGRELSERYAIACTIDNQAAVEGADLIVLCVKPQTLTQVMPPLKGMIPDTSLVLSIIAGAKISTIASGLDHPAVIRSMPNTPAQIGQGMTVWTASPSVTDAQREQARELLGALGAEVFVEEENFLDAATALTGSGPAYMFLFLEALVNAGVQLGFTPQVAKQLVLQTVKGSVDYAIASSQELQRLREQVTSPGGTTAEALRSFDQDGFREIILRAIQAAHRRSIELGKGKERDERGAADPGRS
jgi:pyrroline-5-carboxylate reductase